jgi:hypothetical protein
MNKRVETLAKALQNLDLNSRKLGTPESVKTLDQYRRDAAALLAEVDNVTLSPENVSLAIVDAGYEPAEYMEQFLKISEELNMIQNGQLFSLEHMKRAWAKGHENGFWIARDGNSIQPEYVLPTDSKVFYTEADVKNAEAQGYFSGWTNGILSMSGLPSDADKMPLLGSEHRDATNPYSASKQV